MPPASISSTKALSLPTTRPMTARSRPKAFLSPPRLQICQRFSYQHYWPILGSGNYRCNKSALAMGSLPATSTSARSTTTNCNDENFLLQYRLVASLSCFVSVQCLRPAPERRIKASVPHFVLPSKGEPYRDPNQEYRLVLCATTTCMPFVPLHPHRLEK